MKFIINRKTLISMLFIATSLLGYVSYQQLKMEIFPNAELPMLFVQISSNILEKRVALSPAEWTELKKSNTYSLLQMIRLKGFNESALRRMLVAYEHTLDVGGGTAGRRPTVFSRIVAITSPSCTCI